MTSIPDFDMSLFSYPLPDSQIARFPLSERDQCHLLRYSEEQGISDHIFSSLPQLLPSHTLLVRNNTKVINARLRFVKPTGAEVEIFCLEPIKPVLYEESLAAKGTCSWKCLVGNSKRWKSGSLQMQISLGEDLQIELSAERIYPQDEIHFSWSPQSISFGQILDAIGQLPIPPYLNRETEESDLEDYQTTYAQKKGSVAAPTAGLHFTESLDKAILQAGHSIRHLTLHVGAGTFLPVKTPSIAEHEMHREICMVSRETLQALYKNALEELPITAVGTTSVRTLESLYWLGVQNGLSLSKEPSLHLDQWAPYESYTYLPSVKELLDYWIQYIENKDKEQLSFSTSLLIAPPYRYKMIDSLITNFHQPNSTLLLLIAALIGEDWRKVYRYALENGYRFLSYGDACFLKKKK